MIRTFFRSGSGGPPCFCFRFLFSVRICLESELHFATITAIYRERAESRFCFCFQMVMLSFSEAMDVAHRIMIIEYGDAHILSYCELSSHGVLLYLLIEYWKNAEGRYNSRKRKSDRSLFSSKCRYILCCLLLFSPLIIYSS